MLTKAFILIGSIMVLAGCSIVTPPLEKPVIENISHNWLGIGKTSIFSTTASRRQVIVKFPSNHLCAEAPPDVAEAVASELGLRLVNQPVFDPNVTEDIQSNSSETRVRSSGDIQSNSFRPRDDPSGDNQSNSSETRVKLAESQVEIAKSLETIVEKLFDRTQGAQFFRDGAFHLCLAYLNGIIEEEEFLDLYMKLQSDSTKLIDTELKLRKAAEDTEKDTATTKDAAEVAR